MSENEVELVSSEYIELSADAKTWGMLCHISGLFGAGFIGPLICWLIKKDEYDYVDYHGKEALNFQITTFLAVIVCFITIIGALLIPIIGIAALVYTIIAGIKANEGEFYKYPLCFRFIK